MRGQVLARSVNHLGYGGRRQGGHQRVEAADAQGVHAPDPASCRQLQQAELGKEGAFAQEFRVDPDPRLRLQGLRQRRQLIFFIDPNRVGHIIDPRVQFGIDYD